MCFFLHSTKRSLLLCISYGFGVVCKDKLADEKMLIRLSLPDGQGHHPQSDQESKHIKASGMVKVRSHSQRESVSSYHKKFHSPHHQPILCYEEKGETNKKKSSTPESTLT